MVNSSTEHMRQQQTEIEFVFALFKHKESVRILLTTFIKELRERIESHDNSKFDKEEFKPFVSVWNKFKEVDYCSKEYYECLDSVKDAVARHHRLNRHHPKHFQNGVNGMNIIDVIEMIADWYAASKRYKTQSFEQNLILAKEEHNIDSQLFEIILNTFCFFGLLEEEEKCRVLKEVSKKA